MTLNFGYDKIYPGGSIITNKRSNANVNLSEFLIEMNKPDLKDQINGTSNSGGLDRTSIVLETIIVIKNTHSDAPKLSTPSRNTKDGLQFAEITFTKPGNINGRFDRNAPKTVG